MSWHTSAIAAAVTIAIICLAPSFTITSAQQLLPNSQQQQSLIQSPTLLNLRDNFRVKLPDGWVIQDIKNTGYTLAAEALEGYGLLAELCPNQQEQPTAASVSSSNVTGGSSSSSAIGTTTSSAKLSSGYTGSCQNAREVIHIVRYPNLGAWLGITSDEDIFSTLENWRTIPNAILTYHLQELRKAGYQNVKILNSIDTALNVDNSTTALSRGNGRIGPSDTAATATTTIIPAKLVEITYSTKLDPNETRTGYFILTATAATPRNLGTLTGYSIFYEGNSTTSATLPITSTISSGGQITRGSSSILSPLTSSSPISLPIPARGVFDSFELVAQSTPEPLAAEITLEETHGIAPATFEFKADVSGGLEPYTIRWDFGDGTVSSQGEGDDDTIEHTFELPGVYNVRVFVTDSTGRTASDSIPIIVDEPPPLTAVDIISNATVGTAPATFDFEANVTGGVEPYTYRWNFGDGTIETDDDDEHMVHTFDSQGIYNVSLIVTDSTGGIASDNIPIVVDEPLPPPALRLIEIIPSDTVGTAPATFDFEANVTGGVEPYTYRWNFGDGRIETDTDNTIEHTFELAGVYNVSLTVIDTTGRTVDDSISIRVEPPLPPLGSADIISNATVGTAPATFDFEANVTGGVEPYTYRWNFGDGSTESNTRSVTHTFNQTGRYNVRLIVTDNQNQVASDRIAITVEEGSGPLPPATEQEPILANQVDSSGSDRLFESDDLLGSHDQPSNNNNDVATTVGGTGVFDDYDDTADD
ncbi:MAG: PKD domain-containing protein [Nitrososphaera sp.]